MTRARQTQLASGEGASELATADMQKLLAHRIERDDPTAHKPRRKNEKKCGKCGHRVTVGPDGTEYGHARGARGRRERCPLRPAPEKVDPSDAAAESDWSPLDENQSVWTDWSGDRR